MGEPIDPVPPKPSPDGPDAPLPNPVDPPEIPPNDIEPPVKLEVKLADGKVRHIRFISTTSYWSADGKPISAREFMDRLFGDLSGMIADEDALRKIWSDPDTRHHFLTQLADRGYDRDLPDETRSLVDAPDSDLFDVLSYVLFTTSPKTRQARVLSVKEEDLSATGDEMKQLLFAILRAYEVGGESELELRKLTQTLSSRYGGVGEGKAVLGALPAIKNAFRRMLAGLNRR
ncbi:type I restriction-modification enzyme R subunit C-terminal domain-containing protein [Pseudoruegeria sp. SK021]|uniref:type I restriction-modification enzyme R subunit C-terminal domain-containing protein n=1 Tax=Pseudoruegeria sp. SK021 TaxID=1933035 RepID=UPI00143D90D0|nr:type I restriction-modification enzyme R subunit C-terminal domain-containing protein [Pseudoruegeria sp. SK021]